MLNTKIDQFEDIGHRKSIGRRIMSFEDFITPTATAYTTPATGADMSGVQHERQVPPPFLKC